MVTMQLLLKSPRHYIDVPLLCISTQIIHEGSNSFYQQHNLFQKH